MLIGITDIIAAGELACKLHTLGSSRYTSANQEYRDFMRDIDNVSTALYAIQNEVKNFNGLSSSARPDMSAQHLSALDLAISGVHDTLKRSEKLLRDNPKFEWSREGYIVNIEWNFDIAERVKALQTRILFHCTKINLVIQPLQMYIQNNLRQMLAVLHGDMDDRFQHVIELLDGIGRSLAISGYRVDDARRTLPMVPTELAERFDRAASSNAPAGLDGVRDYFDAIVYHYEESTRNFVPVLPTMVRPTVLQYLNLLKCLWLSRRMRQDPFFDRFCQDTLSAAYVRQIERRVGEEFRRFEGGGALQAPDLDEILLESEAKFEIWPDLGIIDATPNITEAQGFEIELFKVPLQPLNRNRNRNLAVFRSGEDSLRLVEVISSPNVPGERERESELDCRKVVLVPLYAHPENQSSCSFSWKSSADVPRMKELPFKDRSVLLRFQEAVTNFAVRADLSGLSAIRAKLSGWNFDGKFGTELGGEGHIQLWLYSAPPAPNRTHREQSVVSVNSSSTGSSSGHSWSHEYIIQRNPNSSLRSDGIGNYLDPTVPAQLVVFTSHHRHLRLISIAIDENTTINADLCDCSNRKKASECKRFVIQQTKGIVKVKIYSTESSSVNEDMSKFNVALLRHPSHYDAKNGLEELPFKFVTLDLKSAAAREHFCKRLKIVQGLVRQNVESYNQDLWNMRNPQISRENG